MTITLDVPELAIAGLIGWFLFAIMAARFLILRSKVLTAEHCPRCNEHCLTLAEWAGQTCDACDLEDARWGKAKP